MSLSAGISLKNGEICHSRFAATRLEAHPQYYDDDTDEESGVIYVTSQRFIFKGSRKTKTLLLSRLAGCDGSTDVLTISAASGKTVNYHTGPLLASSVAEQLRAILAGGAPETVPRLREQPPSAPPKNCDTCNHWSQSREKCKIDGLRPSRPESCPDWEAPSLPDSEPPVNLSDPGLAGMAVFQSTPPEPPVAADRQRRSLRKQQPSYFPGSKSEWFIVLGIAALLLLAIAAYFR